VVTGQMLDVSNLSKSFGRFQALRDVSFSVPTGSRTLLLGPNAAGKSTLIKAIMGLYKFDGSITVDGLDVSREGSKARDRMGYVPQNSAFYTRLTVEQEARLIGVIKGVSNDTVIDKLERLGLGKARNKTIGSLSGGARQRFALAMALLTSPPLLVFDEPLASVDLRGQLGFLEFVKALSVSGTTLLIATHLTGLSDIADQAVVLNRGRLVAAGPPAELLARMNAEDTLYIRPKAGMEDQVSALVASASGRVLDRRSRVMVVAVPPGSKVALLKALFSDGDIVEDISMDHSQIESSYSKLLQKAGQGDAKS
jgi:Cu-processing system ATP-binding protein